MSAVIFKCPVTGKNLNSGLETDEGSLGGMGLPMRVRCPHCGTDHVFQTHDAKLRDTKISA